MNSDSLKGFIHRAPKGYSYQVKQHKRNLLSIWLCHHYQYMYRTDDCPVTTIWGFYDTKKECYYQPINSTKQGDQVNIMDTTPYSAMQLKLSPLERAFI